MGRRRRGPGGPALRWVGPAVVGTVLGIAAAFAVQAAPVLLGGHPAAAAEKPSPDPVPTARDTGVRPAHRASAHGAAVTTPTSGHATTGHPTTGHATTGSATTPAGPGAEPTRDVIPASGPLAAVPAAQRGCPQPAAGFVTHARTVPGRTVALTFDDGPDAATAQDLDVLAREHVHATFFVVGQRADAHPALVRRIAAEGHLVGDHTYDHVYPRDLPHGWTPAYLAEQIGRTARAISSRTGGPVCWFRPPGGEHPGTVAPAAHRMRMTVTLWSVDTRDWEVQGLDGRPPATGADLDAQARTIYRRAIAGGSQRHPVILFHDGGGFRGATSRALPAVIDWYRSHGYAFVRVDGRS